MPRYFPFTAVVVGTCWYLVNNPMIDGEAGRVRAIGVQFFLLVMPDSREFSNMNFLQQARFFILLVFNY